VLQQFFFSAKAFTKILCTLIRCWWPCHRILTHPDYEITLRYDLYLKYRVCELETVETGEGVCAQRAREARMCGPPTHHSGPNTVAQFGPNLLVLLGLPAITFTRRIVNRRAGHAEMGARRSPAPFAGSSVFARCRWRGEGSVTACGRTVAVRLAQRSAATDADRCRKYSETHNRPAAPGRRAGELFGRLPVGDFLGCFAHPLSAYRLSGRKFLQIVKNLVNFAAFSLCVWRGCCIIIHRSRLLPIPSKISGEIPSAGSHPASAKLLIGEGAKYARHAHSFGHLLDEMPVSVHK
jgi:hypothetical protein